MTRSARRLVLAVTIATAAIAGACAESDPVAPAEDAAVGVRAAGCSLIDRLGTGAVVTIDGRTLIVTSAHTVAGASSIVVEGPTQRSEVDLLAIDTELDVAVLEAPIWSSPGRPLTLPRADQPVRLAVWDPDEPIAVADTIVTRLLRVTIEDIYTRGEFERRAFEVDASVVRGDSGAPIVADDGSIVGVVYARSRERGGVAFAVSTAEIEPVINRAGDAAIDSGRCA